MVEWVRKGVFHVGHMENGRLILFTHGMRNDEIERLKEDAAKTHEEYTNGRLPSVDADKVRDTIVGNKRFVIKPSGSLEPMRQLQIVKLLETLGIPAIRISGVFYPHYKRRVRRQWADNDWRLNFPYILMERQSGKQKKGIDLLSIKIRRRLNRLREQFQITPVDLQRLGGRLNDFDWWKLPEEKKLRRKIIEEGLLRK